MIFLFFFFTLLCLVLFCSVLCSVSSVLCCVVLLCGNTWRACPEQHLGGTSAHTVSSNYQKALKLLPELQVFHVSLLPKHSSQTLNPVPNP